MKSLIIILSLLFISSLAIAQSHVINKAEVNCRLSKAQYGTEASTCPACYKEREDERKKDLAKREAAAEAITLKFKKEKEAREKQRKEEDDEMRARQKSNAVLINGPKLPIAVKPQAKPTSKTTTTKTNNKSEEAPALTVFQIEQLRKQQEINLAEQRIRTQQETGEAIAGAINDILGGMQRAREERDRLELEKETEKKIRLTRQINDLKFFLQKVKAGDQYAIKQVNIIYEEQIAFYKKERNKRTSKAIIHPSLVVGFGAASLFGSDYILSKEPFGEGGGNEIAYYTVGIGGAVAGVFFLFKSIESLVETGNYQADKDVYKNAKDGLKRIKNTNRLNVSFSPSYNPIHKMYGFNLKVGL